MKIILSLVIIISGYTFSLSDYAAAQQRTRATQISKVQVRIPANIRQRSRAVTIIKPNAIHQTARFSIISNSPQMGSPANVPANVRANTPRVPPSPRPGVMGSIKAAPQGKLNVTLTAKKPAVENRAYLSYQYPQSVFMNEDNNHIVF